MATEDFKQNSTETSKVATNPIDDVVSHEEIDKLLDELDEWSIKADIELVMEMLGVTKLQALRAFIKNDEDIVDAILDLTNR